MVKWLSRLTDTQLFPVRVWVSQQNENHCAVPSHTDNVDIRSGVANMGSNPLSTTIYLTFN